MVLSSLVLVPNNIFTDSIESVRNDVNHVRQVLRDVLQTSESSKNMYYVCMVILRLTTVVDFQIVQLKGSALVIGN